MPKASVTRIHPGPPRDMTCVQVPEEVAEGASTRLFGIEAAIRHAATVVEGSNTADALTWIADEVSRLHCDLDCPTWPRRPAEAEPGESS
jgi:hypothetical protein